MSFSVNIYWFHMVDFLAYRSGFVYCDSSKDIILFLMHNLTYLCRFPNSLGPIFTSCCHIVLVSAYSPPNF
jgi:hypothetical protein